MDGDTVAIVGKHGGGEITRRRAREEKRRERSLLHFKEVVDTSEATGHVVFMTCSFHLIIESTMRSKDTRAVISFSLRLRLTCR